MKTHLREYLGAHIVVRIARISEAGDSLAFLDPWLSPVERERAGRFHFAEDRARFILGRGLLRKSLGSCLGLPPEAIRLALTDRDRPVLPQDESLQFSITHTHDLAAVALTAGARVGIDFEWIQGKSDLPELAKWILSEADFRAFQALSESEKIAAFFRIWTRKEAYLKASGEGITDGLQQISVSFGLEKTSSLRDSRDGADPQAWRLISLPVPAEYAGSLACDDSHKQLECEFVRFDRGEMVKT